MRMWIPHAVVLVGVLGCVSSAYALDYHIDEVDSVSGSNVAQLKPGVIVFSDESTRADGSASELIHFEDWARTRPVQKKFLSLFPSYTEPPAHKQAMADAASDTKVDAKEDAAPAVEKLYMYVAQARFILDRRPADMDLARYVALPFLEKIDPAIKHKLIAAADLPPLTDQHGIGNENPDRKWCTGRPTLICIHSDYKLEGKIPLGIMLANKLRDSSKKISERIDFDGELSQVPPADLDQAGLKELTALDTTVEGVLEQNIFYVNQIIKFGKLLAVFQDHPTEAGKTVVTAYMALAIEASVLDKKREFAQVPVLRNLVPIQVLMGKSSFNSGTSISAGLPQYARNEIKTVADVLARDSAPHQ